jgi:hypothetical protein
MPRRRVLGSYIGPATQGDVAEPRYAVMMEPGGVSSSFVADSSLYPIGAEVDTIVKYRWLYRAWKLNLDYHIPDGGVGLPEETGELEILAFSAAADESELVVIRPPAFTGVLSSTVGTITTTGVGTLPWNPEWVLNICNRNSDFVPPASPDTNNYYYNTVTGLYFPRVEFRLGSSIGALGSITNYTPHDDGNVNTAVQSFPGTWQGAPITIQCVTSTTRPFDEFNFTAVPYRAWKYNGSDGDIWDEILLTEIGDHNTVKD